MLNKHLKSTLIVDNDDGVVLSTKRRKMHFKSFQITYFLCFSNTLKWSNEICNVQKIVYNIFLCMDKAAVYWNLFTAIFRQAIP